MVRYESMGLLAKAKQKQQEKFNHEFISLYDSVMYLGEPLDEALEYILKIMSEQILLYLDVDGCYQVYTQYGDYDDDCYWYFSSSSFYHNELAFNDILAELKSCIDERYISQDSIIYNLGFGRKGFLVYLQKDGLDVGEQDIANSGSPTLMYDKYADIDNQYIKIDHKALQNITDERDELRRQVTELKKQGKPKHTTPQGDDLLILGAVMETLANENVNPYTQKLLIDKIIERFGNIKGISESTLTKKFAESKDYIKKENEILL